jgi:hypothetical protein
MYIYIYMYRRSLETLWKNVAYPCSLGVIISNILRVYSTEQHKTKLTCRRAPCQAAKDVAFLSNSSAKSSSDTSWMHKNFLLFTWEFLCFGICACPPLILPSKILLGCFIVVPTARRERMFSLCPRHPDSVNLFSLLRIYCNHEHVLLFWKLSVLF